jgi:hypothetical protein
MDYYKNVDLKQTLSIIREIESEDCRFTNHKSDATGCYGMRPIAYKDIKIKPSKHYSKEIQYDHARLYAKRILAYSSYPNTEFLVYALLKGPSMAHKVQKQFNYGKIPYRNPFSNHWYVKRYQSLLDKETNTFLNVFLFNSSK